MKRLFLIISILCFSIFSFGQVVTTIPTIPVDNDTVTVIFDASEGNGELAGFSGIVYAHTGVITSSSSSPSDWKYVQGNWGTADPNVQMASLGNDKYQLKYHLRNFYGVPMGVTIQKLAFVFRNQDGSLVGRNSDGSDIFVDVATAGLNLSFITPNVRPLIYGINDPVNITLAGGLADTLRLFVNGMEVKKEFGNSLTYSFMSPTAGTFELKATAEGNGTTLEETRSLYIRAANPPTAALPAGSRNGVNYLNDSTVRVVLFAPGKNYAFLYGSFFDWEIRDESYMNITPDRNRFWTEITGLTPGKEYVYQFLVDGELRIADYYAEKILDPWRDGQISSANYPGLIPYPYEKTSRIASVLQTARPAYAWQVLNFTPPKKTDLVIYELLVRDFSEKDDFQSVIDSLDYLERLGVNAIEFMPVMEFENNDSWGYACSFLFALDKFYGTREKFKELIDACHARGMAVILDIVFNHHCGQSSMVELYWDAANSRPDPASPWFNPIAKHDFNVCFDMNHESASTKAYVLRNIKFWMTEFNIDGFRFDLSKGFTQKNTLGNTSAWANYDANRVAYLKSIADTIWSVDADSYMILEHLADNDEEKELANYGMMLWGNHNHAYNEATMGYNNGNGSNFDWISYQLRGWNDPHVVGYMESHDEERLMYKNQQFGNSSGSYNVKDLETGLERIELAANFFFTIPGPKMIWQFEELGFDFSIDDNGRTGRKPVKWDYYQDPNRRKLYNVFASLTKLKTEEPAFETNNYQLQLSGSMKSIHLNHSDMDVAVLGNFDVVSGQIDPAFQSTGKWYEFHSGDSIQVTNVNDPISLNAGEYRLYTTKRLENISTGIEEVEGVSEFSIYPNPVKDILRIEFDLKSSGRAHVEMLDLQGRSLSVILREC